MQIDMGNIAYGFQVFRKLLDSDTPAADLLVNADISTVTAASGFKGVQAFHTHAPSVW